MGIQHKEVIPASFADAFSDNYLGDPEVVSRLVVAFCVRIEALVKARLNGDISPDQLKANASADVIKISDIFAGRNPEYKVIKGYHGYSLPGKLIGDLLPHWQVARKRWNDDPTCVLFDWLFCLVMEATRKWPDESDDYMKEIDLKPSIQYTIKVLLGIEERVQTLPTESESLAKSHIPGYTKADGTVVKPHEDKRVKAAKPPAKWSSGAPTKPSQAGLWGSGGSVPTVKAYHPKLNDKGKKVGMYSPSVPNVAALSDPGAIATITPGCEMPGGDLNGVAFAPWAAPEDEDMWDYVDGVKDDLNEPELKCPIDKQAASGLIIAEPDGRVWVVSPTNKFGGYSNTFPKGKVEEEMSFQANAIKEAWEEAGIKAEVVSYLGDVERTTSMTRYYLARRVAGNPAADMGWESQAVHLVPISKLKGFLDAKVDHQVVDLLAG